MPQLGPSWLTLEGRLPISLVLVRFCSTLSSYGDISRPQFHELDRSLGI